MRRLSTGTLSACIGTQGHTENKVFFFPLYFPLSLKLKYETPAILKKFKSIFQCKLLENMDKDNFI